MKGMRTLALCAAVLLVACSRPPGFEKPMGQFSQAAGTAEDALRSYDQALAVRVTALRRADAVAMPDHVRAADNDCGTGSTSCSVALYAKRGDPAPQALTVKSLIPTHLAAMREVRLYASALEAIAKADATPAVKAAFDQASATAVSLAELSGQPGLAPAVKAFSVPIAKTAVWLYGQYQEAIKLKALRDATGQMEPVMQNAVAVFSKAADYASLPDKVRLVTAYDTKMKAFEDGPVEATLVQALEAAQRLDAALSAQPSAVFLQLGLAHHDLTEAVIAQPGWGEGKSG